MLQTKQPDSWSGKSPATGVGLVPTLLLAKLPRELAGQLQRAGITQTESLSPCAGGRYRGGVGHREWGTRSEEEACGWGRRWHFSHGADTITRRGPGNSSDVPKEKPHLHRAFPNLPPAHARLPVAVGTGAKPSAVQAKRRSCGSTGTPGPERPVPPRAARGSRRMLGDPRAPPGHPREGASLHRLRRRKEHPLGSPWKPAPSGGEGFNLKF